MNSVKSEWYKKNIPIKDLSLWDENARFPEEYFNKAEEELIDYFLKKKELKIRYFTKEIVNEFDLPQLERIVVLNLRGKNIVLEGNRRLVVYKLLVNPSLAREQKTKTFFKEIKKNINIDYNFRLEANITSIKAEGLRFLDRKHNKGNNEVGWNEPERRNFAIRRRRGSEKDILRVELTKAVKSLSLPDEIKESVLGKGYVTTFFRIIDSASARAKLGYDISEDGKIRIKNRRIFNNLLKIIVFNVWAKEDFNKREINSRTLNKMTAVDDYIKNLEEKNVNNVDKEIKDRTKEDLFGEKILDVEKSIYRRKRKIQEYDSLIGPTKTLPSKVKSDKIKDVFGELQEIKLSKTPTAGALLLRTLMELTVKEYVSLNLHIKTDNNGYIRTKSGKAKESLKEKIDYISENFADNEIKESVRIFNANSIFTENLNKIAHSRYIFASKPIVISLWKNSHAFWEFLMSEIIKFNRFKKK